MFSQANKKMSGPVRQPSLTSYIVINDVLVSNSQLSGLFGKAFGQRGEALVAAAHHSVQTGTLCWTPQRWRAAVLIIT